MGTGPFITENAMRYPGDSSGFRINWEVKRRYKSAPPHTEVLPYRVKYVQCKQLALPFPGVYPTFDAPNTSCAAAFDGVGKLAPPHNLALERCYANFRSAMGSVASLGTAMAELDSSFQMIESRALQAFASIRALRQGDIRGAAGYIGLNSKSMPKKYQVPMNARKKVKDIGGAWLEYWFGWAPTINDINTAVNVIQKVPKTQHYNVVGTAVDEVRLRNDSPRSEPGGSWTKHTVNMRVDIRMIGDVSISNPSLRLAHDLGFTNPGKIIYETIPFSWLLDWVVPIGSFLDQIDHYLGLSFENAVYSTRVDASEEWFETAWHSDWRGGQPSLWAHATASGRSFQRDVGVPTAWTFPTAKFPSLSLTRASTAISLLVGQLKG